MLSLQTGCLFCKLVTLLDDVENKEQVRYIGDQHEESMQTDQSERFQCNLMRGA